MSMKYMSLPQHLSAERPLSFYLAMEEYAVRHLPDGDDDLFFMWQVAPTVIYGRNQVMANELDADYCRRHGISIVQRKSGGGCVYADQGNIMLSYITREQNTGLAFNTFIGMLVLVLRRMGVEAVGTAHNDVLINGRKVSGTACYKLSQGCIVHGTLLYDINMQHMLSALTPGPEKLQAKGIQSVRQRVTLLKDHTAMDIEEVKTAIRQTLCTGEHSLTEADVAEIELLQQHYGETS